MHRRQKDPVIEAYKSGIDRSLIKENLKLNYTERAESLMQLQKAATELRKAGIAHRRLND